MPAPTPPPTAAHPRRRPTRPTRRIAAIGLVAFAFAACSGDDDAGDATTAGAGSTPAATTEPAPSTAAPSTAAPSTAAPTTEAPTTVPPTTVPATFEAVGEYAVGVTTLSLAGGVPVEVWYPTSEPATGTVGYDVRDFVPPAVRDLLTADVPASFTYPGTRDVAVADGTFPLVVFSHGFSGMRVQSSFLTSHLASHGMVVAAPEHASRNLTNNLANTASGDPAESVDDVRRTIDLLVAEAGAAGGRFEGAIDTERIGLVGHSAGGFTVVTEAATDPRVDGYVSLASGGPRDGGTYPAVPSLFMAGATDAVVAPATVTRPAFDAAPSPSWYVELASAGHNAFDDFCTFGNGTGIIGIAEASGLGPLLDAQPQLRALGEDGCVPPAAPVDQAFPAIRHAVTSFLRTVFGDEPAPALGPELDEISPLDVTVAER